MHARPPGLIPELHTKLCTSRLLSLVIPKELEGLKAQVISIGEEEAKVDGYTSGILSAQVGILWSQQQQQQNYGNLLLVLCFRDCSLPSAA